MKVTTQTRQTVWEVADTFNLRPHHLSGLEKLAAEMIERWHRGDCVLAEEFLDRHPEFVQRPDAALELIAEEIALRQERGCEKNLSDWVKRFPQWASEIRTLLECQKLLGSAGKTRELPTIGEQLGEFRLVRELGRGGHGQVFLAAQSNLVDRPVVLKISPNHGNEHFSLARLQHSNIVPLYSLHEFPDRGLRALCMPYFGGATLADYLRKNTLPSAAVSPTPSPKSGTAAICRIGVCLAEALHYAHERELVHFDVKPSNVLIAGDGTPMLLDFHLARQPLNAGELAPRWLGGTSHYMSPEHASAMQSAREGSLILSDVDGRTDIYSLGILLRELLEVDEENRTKDLLAPGLAKIISRCTRSAADERYPTAADLAEDLRRHLAYRPLKGVGNRNPIERFRKWRRRRPFALPLFAIAASILCLLGAFGLKVLQARERGSATLHEGRLLMDRHKFAEAIELFRVGERFTDRVPFDGDLREELRQSRLKAEHSQLTDQLHEFLDKARPLLVAEFVPTAEFDAMTVQCLDFWKLRDRFLEGSPGSKTAALSVKNSLVDLGIFASRLIERSSAVQRPREMHQQALEILEQAEKSYGDSCALLLEKARQLKALNRLQDSEEAVRLARQQSPRTAEEYLLAGRALLHAGDSKKALTQLQESVRLDPASLWANYYLGVCRLEQHKAPEACEAFSVCVALAPDSGWCYYNRGLAQTEANRPEQALADFDRALACDTNLAAVHLGKAAVYQKSSDWPNALAELRKAEEAGIALADVEYRRAVLYLAQKNREAALVHLKACLRESPDNAKCLELLPQVEGK